MTEPPASLVGEQRSEEGRKVNAADGEYDARGYNAAKGVWNNDIGPTPPTITSLARQLAEARGEAQALRDENERLASRARLWEKAVAAQGRYLDAFDNAAALAWAKVEERAPHTSDPQGYLESGSHFLSLFVDALKEGRRPEAARGEAQQLRERITEAMKNHAEGYPSRGVCLCGLPWLRDVPGIPDGCTTHRSLAALGVSPKGRPEGG